MKKVLFTLSLLALAIGAKAQGNLQFNQVVAGAVSVSPGSVTGALIVPTGKVWKIENVNFSNTSIGMQINSLEVNINNCRFPFWLKAGDTFSLRNTYTGTGASAYICHYSIIEFNIIP
jgi:hypothetical protein